MLMLERLENLQDLERLAQKLAARIQKGDRIALEGPLGVGKTTLVRLILKAWGYEGAVSSPTYLLMNEYWHEPWKLMIRHIDAFRLKDAPKTEPIWDEKDWAQDIVFVEWPEASGLRPESFTYRIKLDFSEPEGSRVCELIS